MKSYLGRMMKRVLFNIKGIFSKQIVHLECDQARDNLEEYSPKPGGTSLRRNTIIGTPEYDLQIILPAYNVEQYLDACITSVLSQKTKRTFILVVIDDGSTDHTGAIADKYRDLENVSVIHQENRGFSGARNRGLETINAKYLMFLDSDDMLCENAIEDMLVTAEQYRADIVCGGYYYLTENKLSKARCYQRSEQVSYDQLYGQPWGKIYASKLFENVCFPEWFLYEDSIGSFLVYPSASKIYTIPSMVYQYRVRQDSITPTSRKMKKCVDTYWITELLVHERKEHQLANDQLYYDKIMRQIILNQKRIRNVPEIIKRSIFILTRNLIQTEFSEKLFSPQYERIVKALRESDYGRFVNSCEAF